MRIRLTLPRTLAQPTRRRWLENGAIAVVFAIASAGAWAQDQLRYATHDWTPVANPEQDPLNEVWTDTKSPGNGFTYSVGTIQVRADNGANLFSGVGVAPPVLGMTFQAPNPRQIVVVQAVDDNQVIAWQRYIYGVPFPASERPCVARGISVWPVVDPVTGAFDPGETRIAVCGEFFDDNMPLSQVPLPGDLEVVS